MLERERKRKLVELESTGDEDESPTLAPLGPVKTHASTGKEARSETDYPELKL